MPLIKFNFNKFSKLLVCHQKSFDWAGHTLSRFVMVNTLRDVCSSTFTVLTSCYIRLILTYYDPVLEIFGLESFATHSIHSPPIDTHDNLATLIMCSQSYPQISRHMIKQEHHPCSIFHGASKVQILLLVSVETCINFTPVCVNPPTTINQVEMLAPQESPSTAA